MYFSLVRTGMVVPSMCVSNGMIRTISLAKEKLTSGRCRWSVKPHRCYLAKPPSHAASCPAAWIAWNKVRILNVQC